MPDDPSVTLWNPASPDWCILDLDPRQFAADSVPDRRKELNEDPLCGILRGGIDFLQVLALLGKKVRDLV